MTELLSTWAYTLAAVVVGLLAAARLTRLLVHDDYPPSVWVRAKFKKITRDGAWSTLVECHYCASPYIVAGVMLAAWLSDLHTAWWVVCGWLAASYVTAMIVSHDGSD